MTSTGDHPRWHEYALQSWARHAGPGNPAWAGEAADVARLREALGDDTLPTAFHATAQRLPDRPALDVDGARATHGELDERSARVAGWLRSQGVTEGSIVMLADASSLALVTSYLGVLRAGATALLANPTLTARELEHLASDSGAALALARGDARERLEGLSAERRIPPRVHDLGLLFDAQGALAPDLARAEPLPLPTTPDPSAAAVLAYTSGTTGKPKATPRSHRNLLSSIRAAMLAWRWSSDDVCVHSLPLFHGHGLDSIQTALLTGSRTVVLSRFDPERLCARIKAEGTVLFAVPTIYERLMGWEGIESAGLDSLRVLISGSAALPPSLSERVAEIAGQMPLERYGTTESGLDVSNLYDGPRRSGCIGVPLPGIEMAIIDADGAPLDFGQDGEIVLRGPQVFAGYRGNPDATAAAFLPGGWLRTGDIGRVDPTDGYVSINGRVKELIISGGMNIYPREVEYALLEAPGVARAAVVGVPSARWGEEVVAAVVLEHGAERSGDEVLAFARERLASYKCPKRIVLVDELPVNAMGKVVPAALVDLVGRA